MAYYNADFQPPEEPIWLSLFKLALMTALTLAILSALGGCRTAKTTTEYIRHTDTLIINKTDTLIVTSFKERIVYDTIREVSEREITLNINGDTVKDKQRTNAYHGHSNVQNDSVGIYKSLYESLLHKSSTDDVKREETVITKTPWYERISLCALGILLIVWIIYIKIFHK